MCYLTQNEATLVLFNCICICVRGLNFPAVLVKISNELHPLLQSNSVTHFVLMIIECMLYKYTNIVLINIK